MNVMMILSLILAAYPELTPDPPTSTVMRLDLFGTNVALQCYVGVSAFHNYRACWFFTRRMSTDRNEIRCTNGSDYSITLHSVTSSDAGRYQCEVSIANFVSQLPRDSQREVVQGPIIDLEVFGK